MDQVAPAAFNPHVQRVLKSFQSAAEASLSGPSRYADVWAHLDPSSTANSDSAKTAQEIGLHEFRKAMLSSTLGKKSSSTVSVDKQQQPVGISDSSPTGPFFPSPGGSFSVAVPHMGPVFLPMDRSHSEKSETVLEGHPISCFIVGGEKRLCLPQILNTVLQDFTLHQINTICDDLHIFCSRCNRQQLDLLKMTGVLPPNAPSCGLITKTDSERLCNALLHGSPEKSRDPPSPNSFKVYHECFGKCKGIYTPELYMSPNAKCIECTDCHGMFSPQKFVCHSHKALENRTCHWGFDSENWRSYILLAKDQDSRENMQKALNEMKDRYDMATGYKKRRESPNNRSKESDSKRARFEENGKIYDGSSTPWLADFPRSLSAFRPWSPSLVNLIKEGKIPAPAATRESLQHLLPSFLQTGPPVLLNPERVVPFNDTKRYDRHFAPNVSLAPQGKDDEKPEFESPHKVDPKLLSSTSSYSFSSSSTSALSSPSPIKVEKNPEFELSSSDESSFRSESVPTTPRDDHRHLSEVPVPCESDLLFDRDVMVGLVKRALETSPDKFEEHESILEQTMEIWARQEDRIRALVQSRKHLIQEMELLRVSKRERLQEMSESRLLLRQEVERVKIELEVKSRETMGERKRFRQEIDILKATKHPELARVKAKYKGQVESLTNQLQQYEKMNSCMVTELTMLRQQVKGLGRDVADFSNSHKGATVSNSKVKEIVNGDSKEEAMEWDGKEAEKEVAKSRKDAGYHRNGHLDDQDVTIIPDDEDSTSNHDNDMNGDIISIKVEESSQHPNDT